MWNMDAKMTAFSTGIVLVVFLDSIQAECPPGTKQSYNLEKEKFVCCRDIQCKRGYEPKPCLPGNYSSARCELCPKRHFNDRIVTLHSNSKCRRKRNCDHYLVEGDETENAQCHCPSQGEHLEDGAVCRPNHVCHKGFGQTTEGKCERCIHGETFSNETNHIQRCLPVTNCRDQYRCTIKEANISANAVCGPVESDIENCASPSDSSEPSPAKPPGEKSNSKPSPETDEPTGGDANDPKKRPDKPKNDGIVAWIVLGVLAIGGVIGVVVWIARDMRRKLRKNKFEKHIRIAKYLEAMGADDRAENGWKVYECIKEFLKTEACTRNEYLGRMLLGDKIESIISQLGDPDEHDVEKMNLVLVTWLESCPGEGPNIRQLLEAMYEPGNDYHFRSINTRIIASCNLAIPEDRFRWYHNLPILSRLTRRRNRGNRSRSDPAVQYSPVASATNSSVALVV